MKENRVDQSGGFRSEGKESWEGVEKEGNHGQ